MKFTRLWEIFTKASGVSLPRDDDALQLFPLIGPLEFMAIDIRGPLPKTLSGNQFVQIMPNRFYKLTKAVSNFRTIASHIASLLMDNWVVPYEIPEYFLSDSRTQSTSKFFETLRPFLGTNRLTTTASYPQTNGKAECFNQMIIARLQHYVAEHHRYWDL